MVSPAQFIERWRFWKATDRLGPDIVATGWRLLFPHTMRALCEAKFARFGENADFRWGAFAVTCSKISIGRRVVVRPGTMLFAYPDGEQGSISIEDDVLMGSGVHIYTSNHAFDDPDRLIIDQGHDKVRDVRIGAGAWLGANAIILPGADIGEGAVVGAGSVISKPVPANAIAVGNPARVIRYRGEGDARSARAAAGV